MICLLILAAFVQLSASFNIVGALLHFQRSIFSLDQRPMIVVVESQTETKKVSERPVRIPISRTDGLKFVVEPADSIYPPELQCKIIYHRLVIEREVDEDGFDEVTYRIQFEAIPINDAFLGRIFLLHEMELKNIPSIAEAKDEAEQFAALGSVESCFPEVISEHK